MIGIKIILHEKTQLVGRGRNSNGWYSQQNFTATYRAYVSNIDMHDDDLNVIYEYINLFSREFLDCDCEYIFDPINSYVLDVEMTHNLIEKLTPNIFRASSDSDVKYDVEEIIKNRKIELDEFNKNISPKNGY